jgi:hypothetical protein
MIHYKQVDDTTWPVDLHSDYEDSAQWVQRYGSIDRVVEQRLAVASVLSAYSDLTDPNHSLKDATAMLRRARLAAKQCVEGAS